ncbi:MAG: DUF4274 domain-containing protein [Clostridia bacterium]|nr:DUF4274 domain-containing protein [Clostridia bacterium]
MMDNKDLKWIDELLHSEDREKMIAEIMRINTPLFLHIIAANYNWDNGFDVPTAILNNDNCDLGTALMLFYSADGYRMLESAEDFTASPLESWKSFLSFVYKKIINNEFKIRQITFTPPISKVQIYKLKKINPDIPTVFMEKTPGVEPDIPRL